MAHNRREEGGVLISTFKDESQKALSWLEELDEKFLFPDHVADTKARMAINNVKETCEKLLELLFPDKTASEAPLNKFIPCDWDNKIEKDKCQKCGKIPDEMFYRKTKRNSSGGDYWCKSCKEQWEEDNKPEDKIDWLDMTASLDEIAGELERVDPRLALALDKVSDRLENKSGS
jgi:hypothetical protein